MTEGRTAIIVGAGIGGLATSLYLARAGYSVSVFEKNSAPGGRCGQYIREGHRFDLGATMLLMPDIYRKVLGELGIELEEGTDIVPLNNLYTIFFDDSSRLEFTTDPEKMREQLERIEPGSYSRSQSYVDEGYSIFKAAMEKLIGRNFYNLFELVNFRNIGLLYKLKIFTSNWRYARRFFRHKHLLMAYTFQNIYVGQSPFNSPALFSMVPAAELIEGSYAVKGGMFGIIRKVMKAAEKAGVQFHFNTPVSEIRTQENKVTGIITEDGRKIEAGIVVANADLPYVYRCLLKDEKMTRRLSGMNYSCSAVCLHWGLDKQYPQLDHHNVFLSDGFRDGLERIFRDKTIGDRPSFYVHAPVRTDPDAAPAGEDTLSMIVATGHIDRTKKQDWAEIRKKAHDYVVERLKKAGLDDIDRHIKFELAYTPESWESACNVERGSVFGSLGHNILQMGWFRPHNRHDRYHNLYFTGGSTHPGNGIPNILMSAKLVSERIVSGK
ncbi:MAG: phytoene desaturase family protein [Bacteroidales bacterium]|jgi:phytoene desaturase|nr:phytoene desaturase family protein [Bacteroidales bacterium]